MLFISECSGVRETGTVNGLPKHKMMQAETCLFETFNTGEGKFRIFYRRILSAYN
jgi:hypothetical protein